MKAIILLLVFTSGLFAESVKNIKKGATLKGARIEEFVFDDVEYLGIYDERIYYKNSEGKVKSFDCVYNLEITDSNGNIIDYDCDEFSFNPLTDPANVKRIKLFFAVAGQLFAMSIIIDYFVGLSRDQ